MNRGSSAIATHRFDASGALTSALAEALARQLASAIRLRGQALLAVSGGRLAPDIFAALSLQALDWPGLQVLLVDERFVPPGHPANNADLVRHHLRPTKGAPLNLLAPVTDGSLSLAESAENYEAQLRALALPIDVCLLGMGEDGHTASLFPTSPNLAEMLDPDSLRLCHATAPATANEARLTLSLACIARSRCLMIAIAGAEKASLFRLATEIASPRLPLSMVLAARQGDAELWSATA